MFDGLMVSLNRSNFVFVLFIDMGCVWWEKGKMDVKNDSSIT